MKKKKLIIGIIAGVVVVGILAAVIIGVLFQGPHVLAVEGYSIERTDLVETISTTGTVESMNEVKVYSTYMSNVDAINVQVGDTVLEGDVLCQLNTVDISAQIEQAKASLGAVQSANGHQIKVAERALDHAQSDYNAGISSSLLQAQASLESAKSAYQQAKKSEEDARKQYNNIKGNNDSIVWSSNGSTTVADGWSSGVGSNTVEQLKMAWEKSVLAVDSAKEQMANAEKALRAAESGTDYQLDSFGDSVTGAKIAANTRSSQLQIAKLEADRENMTVKAPATGTVTAVYATAGAPGNGLLFVIEDVNRFKVHTNVSEYDVVSMTPGIKATIRSDATGSDIYEGVVSAVAPTANKDPKGDTITAKVEYGVDIDVISSETRLLVGMSSIRVTLVANEKKGVLALPYEMIKTDADGNDIVYIARPAETEGEYTVEILTIQTGLETDRLIEVVSDSLNDGDIIISNFHNVLREGMTVTLAPPRPQAVAGK